ncbi:EMI1 family protein [Sporobolomyces salmoneus]|uniref:EMI1 family protein n=1 Tax=Sporobolomyces salmoneus TaxID=183962 RepID=UPI00317A9C68
MFGFLSKTAPPSSPDSTRTPPSAPEPIQRAEPPRRTFESLVSEELPIQRHSVAMEGGMPSCLTLFDNFLLCYSLASQTKSVYRHGAPRDCSPKFEDFKFCMSVKGSSEEKKEEVWVKRRAEWWAERRLGRSSEDVWDAKTNVYADPKEEKRNQEEAATL